MHPAAAERSQSTPDPAAPPAPAPVVILPPRFPALIDAVWRRIQATAVTQARPDGSTLKFVAFGSRCQISYRNLRQSTLPFVDAALRQVATLEATYSRFLPESLVSRINAAAGHAWTETDPATEQLLDLCRDAHFVTRGIFDPTLLPLTELWYPRGRPARLPSDVEIAAARARVGWRKVQRRPGAILLPLPGMGLDLGALAKEFAVDALVRLAIEHGIGSVLVEFGTDLRSRGPALDGRPAWHISLEDPLARGQTWARLVVKDAAVATTSPDPTASPIGGRSSGPIIDPRTGHPTTSGTRAASVLAPTCTLAGMLATATFVLGPDEGLKLLQEHPSTSGCIITDAGRHPSPTFLDNIVTQSAPGP